MSMNENLPVPPTDASPPTPEAPIDPPAAPDIAAADPDTPAPPAPAVAPPAPPAPPATPAAPPAPPAPPVMAAAPVTAAAVATFPNGKPMLDASGQPASPKSRLVALLLILLLGLGLQRFYVGKIGTGILYLITLGGFGIWFLIDLVMIIVGSFKDKQGRVLSNW